jgi:selenocysteine lyase/cysteine desulfurase
MASSDSAIPVVLATAALCVVLAMMVGHVHDTTHHSVCSLSPVVDSLYASQVQNRVHAPGAFHYMDFTGASLYTDRQLDDITRLLSSGVYGNPHSKSASSRLSTGHVDDVRHKLYQYFRADPEEYVIVFTRSATGASHVARRSVPLFAKLNVRVHSFEP